MKHLRHSLLSNWHLLILLAVLFFASYTKITSEIGPAEKQTSVYFHWGGVLSIWEVFLFASLALLFVRGLLASHIRFNFGPAHGLLAMMILLAIAFAVGLLHTAGGPLSYGLTETRRPVIAFITPVYMFLMYVIVLNSVSTRRQLYALFKWLDVLTIGLLVLGAVRLTLMLTGQLRGLWFFGLPVPLYDQMLMLYVPIFTLSMIYFREGALRKRRWLLLATMVFFILCSTRRFNYFLLAIGILLVLFLGSGLQLWKPRQLVKPILKSLATASIVTLLLLLLAPQFLRGVTTSLKSLNVFSSLGQKYSGDMRVAEVNNLFSNLNERPYAYVTGFGLGTLWQAVERQPVDPLTRRLRISRSWYSQFHLPYISMLFRLGVVGSMLFVLWFGNFVYRLWQGVKTVPLSIRPLSGALFVFLLLILPSIIDSFNPVAWILCGFYVALLERTIELTVKLKASKFSPTEIELPQK